jgi:diguanylate cyclase (GGDEF)-like protein
MVRGRAGAWSWRAPTLLPLPVEYRVRVPGILDGWSSPQSEPRLTLPNLPSGRWVIEVQGRRRGAAAWSPPLTSGFLVPRRPWETWWARGGAAVTVLLLMNLVLRLRTRRHRAREAVLDREVAARTSDLEQARTELELANRSLARLARTDGLTGLANRTAFDERLTSEWARARRSGEPLALILGDVDHFKLYNDHYGHQAGDRCLQVLGGLLAGRARRAADLAARYGGEELVLLLPSLDLPAASRMAEAIVAEVAARRLPHESSPVSPHVTMSLGVASASPHELASPADLLALADRALYRAKARGRNRWQACRTEEAGDLPLAGGIAPRGVNSATAYDAASEEAARMVGAA